MILTCFLEYGAQTVTVHDVLHRRLDGRWSMTVSAYRKLRIAPPVLSDLLRTQGFAVDAQAGPRGLTRLVCRAARP